MLGSNGPYGAAEIDIDLVISQHRDFLCGKEEFLRLVRQNLRDNGQGFPVLIDIILRQNILHFTNYELV